MGVAFPDSGKGRIGKCSLDSDSDRIQWIFVLFCGSEQRDSAGHLFWGELVPNSLSAIYETWKNALIDL